MLARYYGTSLARFLAVDPASSSAIAANPQTWNRYPYARNNPLVLIDPDGRDVILPGAPETIGWDERSTGPRFGGGGLGNCGPVCHDFKGGTKEEQEQAYAEQDKARENLTPEAKAYFKDQFGIDIEEALTPGHGTTVYLDHRGKKSWQGKYSLTGDPWDNDIHLNLDLLGEGDLFAAALLHESGHWAADMATWFGSREPTVSDDVLRIILGTVGRDPLFVFEGKAGYAAEVYQYGRIVTW